MNPDPSSDSTTAAGAPSTPTGHTPWFFQGIDWRTAARYAAILGLLASFSQCLSDLNLQKGQQWPWWEFLRLFCLFAPCAFLGAVFALKTGLEPFLANRPSAWLGKGRQLMIFGVIPGAAIGLSFHRMYAPFRFSPRIPSYLREMDSFYDSFVLSLRAAVTEELVFRFFLLAAFYYIFSRMLQPLRDRGWTRLVWLAVPGLHSSVRLAVRADSRQLRLHHRLPGGRIVRGNLLASGIRIRPALPFCGRLHILQSHLRGRVTAGSPQGTFLPAISDSCLTPTFESKS